MIIKDIQSFENKEESYGKEKIIPNSKLSNEKKKDRYDKIEQEMEFADYFWKPAEAPGSPYWKKIGVNLGALAFIGLFEAFLIFFIELNSKEAIVFGGILVAILVGLNLRTSALVGFFVRFPKKGLIKLQMNNRFEYSFLNDQKDVLFIRTPRTLIGIGLFRLKAIPIKLAGTFERFIRSIYQQQVSLFWFHLQAPIEPDSVIDSEFPAITDKARKKLEGKMPHVRVGQLESHAGIWNERIVIGAHRKAPLESCNSETTKYLLQEILMSDLFKIRSSFKQTFPHMVLEPLSGEELVAAYLYSIQGNAPTSFCVTGNEAVLQFLQIPQIITKSMPHHYPAEFIVPTIIPHDIRLGKAFEPEFQQREVLAGFSVQDLLKGVLVTGGTVQERFTTNTKLVYTAAERGMNYLIITTNPEWRRLLDLLPNACLFRLGDEIIWNPLDPEDLIGNEIIEYANLLMQLFAQLFHLSATNCQILSGAICSCLEDQEVITDLDVLAGKIQDITSITRSGFNNELVAIYKFIENIRRGKINTMLGASNFALKKLVQGINILEIDLQNQAHLQFLCLCFLAKILAYAHNYPHQKFMVLVDLADVLMPLDPQMQSARDAEQYFLEWVRRFRESTGGLHLSLETPSRFPKDILNVFPNILAHRTASYEDNKIIQDILKFLPPQVVLSREVRHDNWEPDYLKELPKELLLMKHPDINNGFPIYLAPVDFSSTHIWSSEELRMHLKEYFTEWIAPEPDTRPLLERDFGTNATIVKQVLAFLSDYPTLTVTALFSSVTSNPQNELDRPAFENLLNRLVQLDYIVQNEWDDGRGHQHHAYQLKPKGREQYERYLQALNDRIRRMTTDTHSQNELELRF